MLLCLEKTIKRIEYVNDLIKCYNKSRNKLSASKRGGY